MCVANSYARLSASAGENKSHLTLRKRRAPAAAAASVKKHHRGTEVIKGSDITRPQHKSSKSEREASLQLLIKSVA